MKKAQIIDFASGREIPNFKRSPRPLEAPGIFRTARQAGAYVHAMAAKMPSLEISPIDGWIVARDVIAATYHHFDDLEQTDKLTLAIARSARVIANAPDDEIGAYIDGRTQRIHLTISVKLITVSFDDGLACSSYSFGQFDDSYIPIDMTLPSDVR